MKIKPYSGVKPLSYGHKDKVTAPGITRAGDFTPFIRRMPNINKLRPHQYSDADLVRIARNYQVLPNGANFRKANEEWLRRIWNLPPGAKSSRVKNELDRIANDFGSRQLRRTCRRAIEQYSIVENLKSNPDKELTRIPEDFDEDRICDSCADLAGEEGTYVYHQSIGLPGAASCDGGNDCRCKLL